eukprot:CAMPEP_0206267024 /NCGR_PEP_ID=MMETSP0047_2-20121206/30916_1 /ASSEMBLY_ACC=CAM_ASM_000192 /TAXON_ID=195065 /ORGANISM="Chroomonas mesostigmatica_cf, Strain CCMP1168" /LENGTH=165 /DNA_ID=CAMNT_0053695175 /DNA_START=196 /DNA_END=690 /DNA_ORIENTATION=-
MQTGIPTPSGLVRGSSHWLHCLTSHAIHGVEPFQSLTTTTAATPRAFAFPTWCANEHTLSFRIKKMTLSVYEFGAPLSGVHASGGSAIATALGAMPLSSPVKSADLHPMCLSTEPRTGVLLATVVEDTLAEGKCGEGQAGQRQEQHGASPSSRGRVCHGPHAGAF